MPIKRTIIVRHGETDYNAEHRWQGQRDIPLNAKGIQQAQAVADYLKDWSIDAVYSSDLKRAFETAEAIARHHNLLIQADQRLREFKLGIFEGLTQADIALKYPDVMQSWDTDDEYILPEGESRLQTRQRAFQAWQEITSTDANTVLIISHGGVIRQLMKSLYPHRDDLPHMSNTAITILDRDEQMHWHIIEFGVTPHLR